MSSISSPTPRDSVEGDLWKLISLNEHGEGDDGHARINTNDLVDLNAWVGRRLGVEEADGAEVTWQLVDEATTQPSPPRLWLERSPTERDLLAIRFLLYLTASDFPNNRKDPIPLLDGESFNSVQAWTGKNEKISRGKPKFEQVVGHRRMLATGARRVGKHKSVNNWSRGSGACREAAETLRAEFARLLQDDAVRARLGGLPLAQMPPEAFVDDEAPTVRFGEALDPDMPVLEGEAFRFQPVARRRRRIRVAAPVGIALAVVAGLLVWHPWHHGPTSAGGPSSGPVRITAMLPFDPFAAVVTADIHDGDPIGKGVVGNGDLPKSWNAIPFDYQVDYTLRSTRSDVVLTGFKLERQSHDPLPKNYVAVTCECGGNTDQMDGFSIEEARSPLIQPFGPSVGEGPRMRLRLHKGEPVSVTIRITSRSARITTWAGELLFVYGARADKRFSLPIGPIRTALPAAGTALYKDADGHWLYDGLAKDLPTK